MYSRLAWRNAKRSISNYFIYIFTMIVLLSIMFISHYVSLIENIGNIETMTLPLLILFISVILVHYINIFMLKQRSKEFANYILLGMERKNLIRMFLLEFFFISFLCFLISSIICFGIGFLIYEKVFLVGNFSLHLLFIQSMIRTFFCFCIMEFFSVNSIWKIMNKLEIRELIIERKRMEKLANNKYYSFWKILFATSFSFLLLLLIGVAYLPQHSVTIILSIIAIPLITSILSFYKYIFQRMEKTRRKASDNLYQNDNLYLISQIAKNYKTSALMNVIFCICLLFSVLSFIASAFLLNTELSLFDPITQRWLSFIQACISVIFIVLYFSILSSQQLMEIKQQINEFDILSFLGKNQTELKLLLRKQLSIKLSIPTYMCVLVLLISTPLVNYRLNNVLPIEMHNLLIKSLGKFSLCFLVVYICYFQIVYFIIKRNLKLE
jgi:Predicted permease.